MSLARGFVPIPPHIAAPQAAAPFAEGRQSIIEQSLTDAHTRKREERRLARVVRRAPLVHGVNAARFAVILLKRREHSRAYLPEYMHELRRCEAWKHATPFQQRDIVRAIERETRALQTGGHW